MPSVVYAECGKQIHYAECHYTECRGARGDSTGRFLTGGPLSML